MGKQVTVVKLASGISLPDSGLYTVGNVVTLSDYQYNNLPYWFTATYITVTGNVSDPTHPAPPLDSGIQAGVDAEISAMSILAWVYAEAYRLVSGTRDANGALTSGSVVWPDGSTGTFTADTVSSAFPGSLDAYHITYVPASGPTKTITQPALTRDATTGAVTAQPALTVV